jgi:glutamate N-acetyltransferase/amino-acid N-acetyltransferase
VAGHPARSPLAVLLPDLPPVPGVRLGAAAAGLRYQGRPDVVMAAFTSGTTVAGVFTGNKCPGAPVDWCRAALPGGAARALVVNAGNANVFTGAAGRIATQATADAAAALAGCAPNEVFLASTGVIGQIMPHEKLIAALPALHARLSPAGFAEAAHGIMTTDTFAKAATATVTLNGRETRITGIAKGSGMIAPDMATMLCFAFTDAAVAQADLQTALTTAARRSFNRITVDSDTSTSDTVLLFATGQAGNTGPLTTEFQDALDRVMLDLAHMVVRDGEGAQKFIRIDVAGAVNDPSAQRIAMAVANSPLVKTAVAGEDANWGRIVMAVGKAGEPADRDRLSIAVGGVWMARNGTVVSGYDEAPVVAHMKGRDIHISIHLGLGDGAGTAWTCDLTHGYIDINGSYRS